jgi:hypothetical protein
MDPQNQNVMPTGGDDADADDTSAVPAGGDSQSSADAMGGVKPPMPEVKDPEAEVTGEGDEAVEDAGDGSGENADKEEDDEAPIV